MDWLWITLGIIVGIVLICFLTAYICFYIAFYVPDKKRLKDGEFVLPFGDDYSKYSDQMKKWNEEVSALPYEEIFIKSFDGLTLRAKYYEREKGAPIEIMFHGYRGNATRDLCGGVQRSFKLGRNVLMVDQRASGKSEGKVITFGVKESRDCVSWTHYAVERFGKDCKIILCGISMGATTVMIASSYKLPKNVVGVIADCGFTSAEEIIKKCVKQMHLPVKIFYPFIKMGAKVFGNFNLEEISPIEAVKKATIPIIFFHGETDAFVPVDMSRINYETCVSEKRLVLFPKTGHGLCYLTDPKRYLRELDDFEVAIGIR